jgi:hypothetical protein
VADDVKMTFTGNAADAERAIAQLERKYDSLENKIKRLKSTSKEGGSGFEKMTAGAVQFGQALTGIGGPLDAILKGIDIAKQEWADLVMRQEKARAAHTKFASPLEQFIFNTQGDAEFKTVASREAEVNRIVKETGVSRDQVAETAGEAASAKAQLPLRRAFDATEATMRLLPNTPAAQPLVAASALDVIKDLPGLDPEDAIGMMISLGRSSRIKDNAALAQHGMPAVIGASKLDRMEREERIRAGEIQRPDARAEMALEDESYRRNAAIVSALTQAAQDPEGRVTRTAVTSLSVQLDEFFRGRPEFANLDMLHERIQFMQDNPQAQKAFFEGGEFSGKKSSGLQLTVKGPDGQEINMAADRASFEKKVLPALMDLTTKGSSADQAYREALAGMPALSQGDQVYREMIAEMKTSPTLNIAEQERRMQGVADRGFFGDTMGATTSVVRSKLDEVLQAANFGAVSRKTAGLEFEARTLFQSPQAAASAIIEPLIRSVESGFGTKPLGLSQGGNQADAQVLREMLDELKKLNAKPPPRAPINPRGNVEAN